LQQCAQDLKLSLAFVIVRKNIVCVQEQPKRMNQYYIYCKM